MNIFSLLCLHILCISWLNAEPLVLVSQGELSGIIQNSRNGRNYSAFLGIPYAQPPIGNLRFKNPLPGGNWSGRRLARSFGNKCPQQSSNGKIGNEDCLFLNVYTPQEEKINQNLLPVMVWIHGGAFSMGSSNQYGAEYILDKDVVLVTINYRLGILGFFTTGDLSAPGNFGLKDQVLALKWVQENIKKFGGDPNQVTIFGQSSGGASVGFHALSQASNGLFQQYIIESGSPICPWAYQNNSKFIKPIEKIAKELGCPLKPSENLVNCLREKDEETLLATDSVFNMILRFANIVWTPTNEDNTEGAFLIDSPENLMKNNQMKDLPFISGVVSDEGLMLTENLYSDDTMYNLIRAAFKPFMTFIFDYFLGLNNINEFISSVEIFYFNDSISSMGKNEFLRGLTDFLTDGAFFYANWRMLEKVTPKMKNYNYLFNFGYEENIENHGVNHAAEVYYLFSTPYTKNSLISEIMVDLWTSFAINGKPTSEKLNQPGLWKSYNTIKNNYLQIGDINNNTDPKITSAHPFYAERMNFWQKNFPITL